MAKKLFIADKSNVSAWIVLKGKKTVAKVQAYCPASKVTVQVFNCGKTVKGLQYDNEYKCVQTKSAGGYGYDKLTAALHGIEIDGIILNDHCYTDKKSKRLLEQYKNEIINAHKLKELKIISVNDIFEKYRKKAGKIGASFANYQTYFFNEKSGQYDIRSYNFEGNKEKTASISYYDSLHYISGLDKLTALGYTVIQAI